MGHPAIISGNILAILECSVLYHHIMGRHIQERGILNIAYILIITQIIDSQDKEQATEADMSIKAVYKTIWTICQLKRSLSYRISLKRVNTSASRCTAFNCRASLRKDWFCGKRSGDRIEDRRERPKARRPSAGSAY